MIVSLSLGYVIDFTNKRDNAKKIPVWLAPRSIIVLRDEARYKWLHGISLEHPIRGRVKRMGGSVEYR